MDCGHLVEIWNDYDIRKTKSIKNHSHKTPTYQVRLLKIISSLVSLFSLVICKIKL